MSNADPHHVRIQAQTSNVGGHRYQPDGDDGSLHPAKRQRILACKRCRHRKQKCDGDGASPCSNCKKANEECSPTEPTLMRARYKADYVQSLEQRLGQLERLVPPEASVHLDSNFGSGEDDGRAHEEEGVRQVPLASRSFSDATSQSTHVSASGASGSPSSYPFLQTTHGGPSQEQPLVTAGGNIIGLVGSLPSSALRQNLGPRPASLETYLNQLAIWPDSIPAHVEEHLIDVYFNNANRRWPFLLKDTFHSWHACWKKRSAEQRHHGDLWQGFFVNMLFAVSLLLDPKQPLSVSHTSQNFYDQAVNHYLPAVLRHPSRLLHVQAYVMMAIHALFSPSTEQISLIISSAVRYCVVARFHLIEAEPEPVDAATRVEIQLRRRAFWAAYSLDRLACGVLRLPFSIADDNITVPHFDNIDDSALVDLSFASNGSSTYTSVSSALHRDRCFQIQSEILNVTMRSDFAMNFDSLSDWRSYILSKLDDWKSQLLQAADSNTKSPTDERWIQIVYNHCLLYLHIPTKSNVRGPAGDWSVQASTRTILIFRKFQGYRTLPHPMLGLISQFSIGITILYCLWATPPKFRTESYNSKKVFEAIRACSNNLTIITERWESTKDLSDIFELLATEVPLAESVSRYDGERATKRISDEAAEEIRPKLPRVKSLVLNRETIRMIEEMISEDFPRDEDSTTTTTMDGYPGIGDKLDLSTSTLPMSMINQPFFTNGVPPLYHFPSPEFLSGDHSGNNELSGLSRSQTMDFPGTFSGYDMF
ncbi:fungal-specific transcription factor domain-containing protein [Exophiala viscosa]|uniref:fungal-specific transcription factor domain-containing protein n=1 Tax=Exophiala viscosa TaxID=2486360 RepID=UPI00218D6095|nr:fungal-specific transcription factor domain-containing protein [Exophiala viscosa]